MIDLLWNMYYKYWSDIPPGQQKQFIEDNLTKILAQTTPIEEPNTYEFPFTSVVAVANNK